MATTYGVTPAGFVRKPQDVILAEINASQKAKLGEEWDTSPESVMGQVNGIASRREGLLWELLETAYKANDPDATEDFLLTGLSRLTGTERKGEEYATVLMTINLDEGVVLESGVHFVEHETDASIRVTPVEDYTAASDGTHTGVEFRAETKGPIVAGSNTLNVIATPVVGWNSANNPDDDLDGGRSVAEDDELRVDREAQIANAGGATLEGVAAAVRKVAGVVSVLPFENITSYTDANGLPPKSFEMVVWDGENEDASRHEIAAAIWKKKGTGARPFGTTDQGTAIDANGAEVLVDFTRSEQKEVYLTFELEVDEDYDEATFELAVVTAANATFTGGKSVIAAKLIAIAIAQPGVTDVTDLKLGFSASPPGSANLPITQRQIARFATARVVTNT